MKYPRVTKQDTLGRLFAIIVSGKDNLMKTRTGLTLVICSLAMLACGACAPQWKPLFDGKTLDGWRPVGNAVWTVEDGCIVGTQDAQSRAGDLITEKQYGDFELEATFKAVWPCNSGIWFRFDGKGLGYQFDILEWKNPEAYTGTIYCPGLPNKQLFLSITKDKSLTKREDWNHVYLSVIGDHIVAKLNGKQVADERHGKLTRGHIGFQVHPGDEFKTMKIIVKEIKIRSHDKP